MNLKTAASRLSIHYQTAYKLVRSGSLAAVKIGGTYEISEAALARYLAERDALRLGAETVPDGPVRALRDRASGLEEVRAVAAHCTTTPRGVFETIAWVAAECVGDMCVVRARCGDRFDAVALHDADPKRRSVLASIVHGYGFNENGPTGVVAHVRTTQRPILVPHVPQDRLRASIDPQHRQFLDQVGVHSLIAVPVLIGGEVEATITMSRNAPGAPYSGAELDFATALGDALKVALTRAAAYQAGWQCRRDLLHAIAQHLQDGEADALLGDVLRHESLAEIVHEIDGTVVTNEAAARLGGGDASALVTHFTADDDPIAMRLQSGELEYHDDEHDVAMPDGTIRRFIAHRGIVRDDAARPRALVVVAQPLPHAA
jgi:excisionase family DNA binding protein